MSLLGRRIKSHCLNHPGPIQLTGPSLFPSPRYVYDPTLASPTLEEVQSETQHNVWTMSPHPLPPIPSPPLTVTHHALSSEWLPLSTPAPIPQVEAWHLIPVPPIANEELADTLEPGLLDHVDSSHYERLTGTEDPDAGAYIIHNLQRTLSRPQKHQENMQKILDNIPLVFYIPDPKDSLSPMATLTPGRKSLWEARYAESKLPYAHLEGSRAGCLICITDLDELRRHDRTDDLRHLDESGESPEPLSRLPCSHVFHKSCLDKWILGESRSCPYCRKIGRLDGESDIDEEGLTPGMSIMCMDSSVPPWTGNRSAWQRVGQRARRVGQSIVRVFGD